VRDRIYFVLFYTDARTHVIWLCMGSRTDIGGYELDIWGYDGYEMVIFLIPRYVL
jgi:hypothetical protein